jgi:predicted small lipoprotein YifL
VRRAALAAVLLAALTACGTGPAQAPPGLRVTVEQSRDNENRGLVQVVVTNDGSAPVVVRRVQLRSAAYRPVPAAVFEEQVRPGSRTAFPVPLGEPDCAADGTDGSTAVVGLRDGGSVREVLLPVPDDDPVLPRLHARACAVERVGRAADVTFSTGWVLDGDVVSGQLVVERRDGAAEVRVTDLQSSILFLLQPTAGLPLVLGPQDRRAALPVEVRAVRCDPHALIESKRSYTFPVFVALGDDEPLQLPVTADEAGIALMDAVLRERCAAEGVDLGG